MKIAKAVFAASLMLGICLLAAPASAAQFTPLQCSEAKKALDAAKTTTDLDKVFRALGTTPVVIQVRDFAVFKVEMAKEIAEGCK